MTFAAYVLTDSNHVLDAEKAFVSIALFNLLQAPLIVIPYAVSSAVQVRRFSFNTKCRDVFQITKFEYCNCGRVTIS